MSNIGWETGFKIKSEVKIIKTISFAHEACTAKHTDMVFLYLITIIKISLIEVCSKDEVQLYLSMSL